jgi:hypothetical protein
VVAKIWQKKFRDLFVIFGKWLGLNLEIFLDFRVPFGNLVDCGLILDKYRGFFAKWRGFSSWGFILSREMWWTWSTSCGPM